MKEKNVYFSRFLLPAIAFIGFFIPSGCVMEDDEGDFNLFPGGLPITRVSVDGDGVQGDGQSYNPSVSADGRYVVFYSSAVNLVSGDINGADDIFVYDRTSQTVERVSVNDDGQGGDAGSTEPSISADGRYVAFHSLATNLVSEDTNGVYDIFVFDRTFDTIERVSVDNEGVQGDAHSFSPAISADGRYIVFHSGAANFVSGDTNGTNDIFVFDRNFDTIERVSVDGGGVQGNGHSYNPAISADGRYVAFYSAASNLVSEDTNGANDIFVFDRTFDTIERVSVDGGGVQGTGASVNPAINADGRYVAFYSAASNLVFGDTNGVYDIFVFDRNFDTIERVSVDADGVQGDGQSYNPCVSADGRYVAFGSDAANLILGDTNIVRDVFVAPVGK